MTSFLTGRGIFVYEKAAVDIIIILKFGLITELPRPVLNGGSLLLGSGGAMRRFLDVRSYSQE